MTLMRLQAALYLLLLLAIEGNAADWLIVNANVIPMDRERVLRDHDVLVMDNVIVRVEPAGDIVVSDATLRIDADGGWLLPGLAEMHAHLASLDFAAGNYGNVAIDDTLRLLLANGVVLARSMLGEPAHLQVRADVASGSRIGPELLIAGPSLSGQSVRSRRAARDMVLQQSNAGYDLIRIHPGLSRSHFSSIARTSKQVQMPFAGHVSEEAGLQAVLDSGQASIEHLHGYARAALLDNSPLATRDQGFYGVALAANIDYRKLPELAQLTADSGIWNAPTMSMIDNALGRQSVAGMLQRNEMRYIDAATREMWAQTIRALREQSSNQERTRILAMRDMLVLALQDAGAGLLLGSDAPKPMNVPGFSVHRELQALVNAGLTPFQALATGTVNVGRHLQRADIQQHLRPYQKQRLQGFGTITPGAPANLLLLADNPLDNIANSAQIVAVARGGNWYDRKQLDGWLDAIASRHQSSDE
jgi:imidazolonepropionase-like amidohydrolase